MNPVKKAKTSHKEKKKIRSQANLMLSEMPAINGKFLERRVKFPTQRSLGAGGGGGYLASQGSWASISCFQWQVSFQIWESKFLMNQTKYQFRMV